MQEHFLRLPDYCDEAQTLKILRDMLDEDIQSGDVTTALFPGNMIVLAAFTARSSGVMCGLPFIVRMFRLFDPDIEIENPLSEGVEFSPSDVLFSVRGKASSILILERTSLNLLSRLSGIAARTRLMVNLVEGRAAVLDTRKTTPLLRNFEKYAVKVGGGVNHRHGLYDQVLVKDNHITLLSGGEEDFSELVKRARANYGSEMKIEIEVDTIEQFRLVLRAEPDMILLDNMSNETLKDCVKLRDDFERLTNRKVLLEASGGINSDTIAEVSKTGVDRISVGSLTYNPIIVDIGLDFQR